MGTGRGGGRIPAPYVVSCRMGATRMLPQAPLFGGALLHPKYPKRQWVGAKTAPVQPHRDEAGGGASPHPTAPHFLHYPNFQNNDKPKKYLTWVKKSGFFPLLIQDQAHRQYFFNLLIFPPL